MFQTWQDLLFLHWEYDVDEIQQTLPPGLYVDTFEDRAYLGIVPFFMKNVRPRFCPSVPGISNFMETNLRTYVYDERGIAGVWFYSLDANQWLAVKLARTFFKLPYFYAAMHEQRDQSGQVITYDVGRRGVDQGFTHDSATKAPDRSGMRNRVRWNFSWSSGIFCSLTPLKPALYQQVRFIIPLTP